MQKPVPEEDLTGAWEENIKNLEQIQSWDLRGRIAVQVDRDGGSASLTWTQREDEYVIRIIGPLGKGTMELTGSSAGVSMRDADRRIHKAINPETLLLEYLGWQVPISGMLYWIRGLPDPLTGVETLVLDDNARLSELSQAGWRVSFQGYKKVEQMDLPTGLEMRNQDLKVKLLIRKWKLSQ